MNNQRRVELRSAVELLKRVQAIVEAAGDEEQEYYDAMPEGLQTSERGERAEAVGSELADLTMELEEITARVEETME